MSEQREWKVGDTTVRFEPPDLVWVHTRGQATFEDAPRLVDIYRELGQRQPLLIVADLSQATTLDPEGGRYISEHVRPEWIQGCIYIGARLLHRAISKGIALAVHLMGRADASALTKVHFVANEAEARALIDRMREQRLGKVA
jgi:MFS superfamily sulfate permease-like transporter